MFEHDYLMRMFLQLFKAIARSMERAREHEDPQAAADMLEDAIAHATNVDGSVLLLLTPDSMASILEVSGTDPRVAEYVGRTLFLEADYLNRASNADLAQLRIDQAHALAAHYGFSVDEELGAEAAMEAFLYEQDRRLHLRETGQNASQETAENI